MIEHYTRLDEVEFYLNDIALKLDESTLRYNYNDCWIDFDVSSLMKKGSNYLDLTLKKRNPHISSPLQLKFVEVIVNYR